MTQFRSITTKREMEAAVTLLERCGIRLAAGLETFLGVYEGDDLLACAGRRANVIQCAAVSLEARGEGLLNGLVSELITDIRLLGYEGAFVFTKPQSAGQFASLGFAVLAQTTEAVLLYSRKDGVARWAATLPKPGRDFSCGKPQGPQESCAGDAVSTQGRCNNMPTDIGCIVMNANPFTLGHRYLVEQAAARCRFVYVLVVEHDGSRFPFSKRLELVQAGTADIGNVQVCPGGPFVISLATFPSYFLKQPGDAARVHAALDAQVFANHIAPALGITVRFVGSEPKDALTADYNRALMETLPPCGIDLQVVERVFNDGEAVSASRVRTLFDQGRLQEIAPLVPEPTYRYLLSLYAGGEPL